MSSPQGVGHRAVQQQKTNFLSKCKPTPGKVGTVVAVALGVIGLIGLIGAIHGGIGAISAHGSFWMALGGGGGALGVGGITHLCRGEKGGPRSPQKRIPANRLKQLKNQGRRDADAYRRVMGRARRRQDYA